MRLAIVVGLALLAVVGCRRPDPVYDRFPRPISMRDVVRAERRAGDLTEPERLAVERALDNHQTQFEAVRSTRIQAFVESIRTLSSDEAFNDPVVLKRNMDRHAAILQEIVALDDALFESLDRALGPSRAGFVDAMRLRRSLDRANALSVGDGGRALPDLVIVVDRLGLEPETRAAISPILDAHAREAAAIADRIGREQLAVTQRYLDLNQRLGPPESAPGVPQGDGRDDAINQELTRRANRSRESLERALFEFSELVDRTVLALREAMPADEWARLDRRILRTRVDDDVGRSADHVAYSLLIASRTSALPRDVRERVAALRERFLAEDTELLRKSFDIYRAGRVPGELVPGGNTEAERRKERRGEIEAQRAMLAKRTTEEFDAIVPEEVRTQIASLKQANRDKFREGVVQLVGAGPASSVIAQRPQGFADMRGDDRQPSLVPNRDREDGALRAFIGPVAHEKDLQRTLARARADDVAQSVAADLFVGYREAWRAAAEDATRRSEAQVKQLMTALESGAVADFRREVGQFLAFAETVRRERQNLDDTFIHDLAAAIADFPPDVRAMWEWERRDLSWRIDVGEIPGGEFFTVAPESMVRFFDVLTDAQLPDDARPCVASALENLREPYLQASERMREDSISALREVVEIMIEARLQGIDEGQAMRQRSADINRAVSPLTASARRMAEVNAEALELVCACVDAETGRSLRLAYLRAAFPRVFDDGRLANDALANVLNDPSLDEARRNEVSAIVAVRNARRDVAIQEVLVWSRQGGMSRTTLRRRSDAALRFPSIAKAMFALDEADARALRAAGALLAPEDVDRHADLARWFDDGWYPIRGYE